MEGEESLRFLHFRIQSAPSLDLYERGAFEAEVHLRRREGGGKGSQMEGGGGEKEGELQTQKGNKRRERGAGRNATSPPLLPPSLHRRPGKAGSKYSGSTACM